MATTTECTIEVPLVPLRQALAAVVVHSEPTKTGDEVNALSRVRLTAGAAELLVCATNTVTSALSAVEIVEDSRKERFAADDGSFIIDLSPGVARHILRVFKAGKPGVDAEPDLVEVKFTTDTVTVSDASGLFRDSFGVSLTVPQLPFSSDYPDVTGILARALGSASASPTAKPLVAAGGALALFRHAATAYGEPVQFEGTGTTESRGFVVLCGEAFIGLASSRHNDDDSLARRDAQRRKHIERLKGGMKLAAV